MSSLSSPARDHEIDADLGERYYLGSRQAEDKFTDEIIEVARLAVEGRFRKGERPARRDAHSFDTGCVQAIFRVDSDLDPDLQHGVFVPGREYPTWIRFSNGNFVRRPDRWPDARGMAIKLMGVGGPKLIDDETHTQDFILISHPRFFVDDLQRYKATLEEFLKGGLVDQYVRALWKLNIREMAIAILVNSRFTSNPLFQRYWSMTPYRLGADPARKLAVKYAVKPRIGRRHSLRSRLAVWLGRDFSLKSEINRALRATEMSFDFFVQRYVDDERTPIEDSKVTWTENVSKLEHVGVIIIPSQDIMSADRAWFCENLSFSPWHGLPEHKPLGLVNRVRLKTYRSISEHRHRLNKAPLEEPTAKDTLAI